MTSIELIRILKRYPMDADICFGDVGDTELYVIDVEYTPVDNRIYLH